VSVCGAAALEALGVVYTIEGEGECLTAVAPCCLL
jgi:hypothetical protein